MSISECEVLLIDDIYPELAFSAAQIAKSCNIPIIADMIPGPDNADLLRLVDVLIAPKHFAQQVGCDNNLDAALEAIHEMGPGTALITLGADGWAYSDPYSRGKGTGFKVDVLDTTGAGDVFHGAFAYGLTEGWDAARCAEFASAVAAIKCTQTGGRTGLPSLSQALDFLRERSELDW
jgi:sugar/nucleoside kinase (ribokinase family)